MPALAGFFLLPLLGGFFFLYFFNRTRFQYRKLEGHRLFFPAAICGLVFFALSRLLTLLLHQTVWAEDLRRSVKAVADFDFSGTAIGALLLGLALPWVGNLQWAWFRERRDRTGRPWLRWPWQSNRDDVLLEVARQTDDLLYLLIQAQREASQILVSLDNGKVYVGYVLKAPLATELPYARLLPTISGYRSKEQLDLELTTLYEPSILFLARAKMPQGLTKEEQGQLERLQIVLKRDKILSASFFDGDLYRRHQEERKRKREASERIAALASGSPGTATPAI